ncbi:MAG: hypothetical protein KAH20_16525 [Methylococcales bacterium]|nr:hypothetical protein [Methylococcales bacterium]
MGANPQVINNGIGSVAVQFSHTWFYPTQRTTYTMSTRGAAGTSTSCQTTLMVI